MGEADVEDIVRLVVKATLVDEVRDLAVQPGVVQEDAGQFHAEEVQRGGEVELQTPDLAVADVLGREYPGGASGEADPWHAARVQLDIVLNQVGDVAIEGIDANHAATSDPVLETEVRAPGRFRLQVRIALEVAVAELPPEQGRRNLVEVRPAHGAGDRERQPVVFRQGVAQADRGQQEAVVVVVDLIRRRDGEVGDGGVGRLIAEAGLPLHCAGFTRDHDIGVDPRFLDGRVAAGDRGEGTEGGDRRARGRGVRHVEADAGGFLHQAVAVLLIPLDAEFECDAVGEIALVLDGARDFLVGDVHLGRVQGEAVLVREDYGVAAIFGLALELVLVVVDRGVAKLEHRLAAEHVALVAGAERQVVGADIQIVVVDRAQVGGVLDAAEIFDRVLVLVAVGADEGARQTQLAAGHRNLIGGVGRIVRAVADVGLDLGVVERAARLVETLAVFVLGIAAVLDVGADQQPAGAGLAAPDSAVGPAPLAVFAVAPVQCAEPDIAAVQRQGITQHDIDGAGHRVARTVGGRGTDHLDALDQFSRDAIDEERPVDAGAGDALAVDQDLGVAGVKASQTHAVGFKHVGQEGDAGHALQGVADGQRLEALEILEVVGQDRRHVVGAVAHHRLAGDDHFVQRRDRALRRGVLARLGEGGASEGERRERGAEQKSEFHGRHSSWPGRPHGRRF